MKTNDKKKGLSDYSPVKKPDDQLKKDKNNNCENNNEIIETEDKLIGDDLAIKKAEQVDINNETPLANKGNNY